MMSPGGDPRGREFHNDIDRNNSNIDILNIYNHSWKLSYDI